MKWVVVGVLFGSFFWGSSFLWAESGPKRPQTLVITNVNVVDTRYGGVHPRMAIAIQGDTIIAVMKFALLESGPQLQVINGNGGYLVPGLWDMKTHVQGMAPESQKALFEFYVANGVTGVRDINTDEVQNPPDVSDVRPEVEPARPLWLQRTNPGEIPKGWRHTVEDMNEIFSVCCSRATAGQRPGEDRGESGSNTNTAEFTSEAAQRTFLELSDHATWVVPGLVAEQPAAANLEQRGSTQSVRPASVSESIPAPPDSFFRDIELVRNMHRVGVQFLTGTGEDLHNPRKSSIAEELELLVRSGLTPLEALQSATINPALCMAKLNKYGVVEADHIADLVLLSGNPLEDIRNARNVSAVVLRGQYLNRAELDAMLARVQNELQHAQSATATRGTTEQ